MREAGQARFCDLVRKAAGLTENEDMSEAQVVDGIVALKAQLAERDATIARLRDALMALSASVVRCAQLNPTPDTREHLLRMIDAALAETEKP